VRISAFDVHEAAFLCLGELHKPRKPTPIIIVAPVGYPSLSKSAEDLVRLLSKWFHPQPYELIKAHLCRHAEKKACSCAACEVVMSKKQRCFACEVDMERLVEDSKPDRGKLVMLLCNGKRRLAWAPTARMVRG
jgi:hypothetical protein